MNATIPTKLREQMADNPWYSRCAVCGASKEARKYLEARGELKCEGRIEWHHHFTWAGKRAQEEFGIIPLCSHHHAKISKIGAVVDWIMACRMTPFELYRFSKATDYAKKKEDLSRRFGGDYISKHPEAETRAQEIL